MNAEQKKAFNEDYRNYVPCRWCGLRARLPYDPNLRYRLHNGRIYTNAWCRSCWTQPESQPESQPEPQPESQPEPQLITTSWVDELSDEESEEERWMQSWLDTHK